MRRLMFVACGFIMMTISRPCKASLDRIRLGVGTLALSYSVLDPLPDTFYAQVGTNLGIDMTKAKQSMHELAAVTVIGCFFSKLRLPIGSLAGLTAAMIIGRPELSRLFEITGASIGLAISERETIQAFLRGWKGLPFESRTN